MLKNLDIKNKGQVFTPENIVKIMMKLLKNKGEILETSAGNGAFCNHIKNCIAIEKDKKVAPPNAIICDFFDYSSENKFNSIIGNPPYVKHNNIEEDTREKLNYKLFDKRSNLFLFFIEKAVKHLKKGGELVFITPREFINLTSARKLNEYLYKNGTITDFIDCGDAKIFNGVCPNVAIWRFEKGNFTRKTNKKQTFNCINGKISFIPPSKNILLSDLFDIKVGAVSGLDSLFVSEKGNCDFVFSQTKKTGKTRKMIFNIPHKSLWKHKNILMNRKIKNFNDSNWYFWGRNHSQTNKKRIYVNCKTREKNPFFIHKCKNYDGSLLALIPKKNINLNLYLKKLNNTNWEDQGFICNGRYIFGQRSLSNAVLLLK